MNCFWPGVDIWKGIWKWFVVGSLHTYRISLTKKYFWNLKPCHQGAERRFLFGAGQFGANFQMSRHFQNLSRIGVGNPSWKSHRLLTSKSLNLCQNFTFRSTRICWGRPVKVEHRCTRNVQRMYRKIYGGLVSIYTVYWCIESCLKPWKLTETSYFYAEQWKMLLFSHLTPSGWFKMGENTILEILGRPP